MMNQMPATASVISTWALLVLLIYANGYFTESLDDANVSARPNVVNIASILTFNSIVGKVSKIALETAIEDVNSDPTILNGTKLKLTIHDSNFSGFRGMMEALKVMESESVAIIGPQSSVLAHVISLVSNELEVPLLSFTATDPTLSSLQFPFFVRTTHSDFFQMAAVADIIEYYEWRQVIAVYIDDDPGRNGIASLADQLAAKRCKISHKAAIKPEATQAEIRDVLVEVALTDSRVLVVHIYADWGLDILNVAHYLGMMGDGYVWIATNWLSTVIDISSPLPASSISAMQGFITLRPYTKDSHLKRKFNSKWKNLTKLGLDTHCLYAYDTVWLLARALDTFFNQGGNVSFSQDPNLKDFQGGIMNLDSLSIFNGGNLLLENILKVKMKGLTGLMEFTFDRNLVSPAFEVINVIGTGVRNIGYWTNYSGLSTISPETLYLKPPHRSTSSQQLYSVIWPGQRVQKPRGWVFPQNGYLKIGVPKRVSFEEFVEEDGDTDKFKGYCIDVFTAAVNLLPYAVPYTFHPFGDGRKNPSNTALVSMINAGVYDAAVGEIAIITNRTRLADFTQPYVESGLVVVVPVRRLDSGTWAFLRPFTGEMWFVTGIFFLLVGAVVWILEYRINDEFRGPPRRQLVSILWYKVFNFSFFSIPVVTKHVPSALLFVFFFAGLAFQPYFTPRVDAEQNTLSTLGRIVVILWLFVVLIINSSYTASLTSNLTVQKLSSPIKGIDSLRASKDPIGYQQSSFVRNYLVEELGIHESRLVPLNLPEDYEKALKDGPKHGGVAAVVDERPYIELFLSTRCDFSIVGGEFTKNGWGFAFPRDSPLAVDMSTALLQLSESGELQRIHDKWLMRSACSSQDTKLDVDRLELKSFKGLFFVCGLTFLLAIFVYFILLVRKFCKHHQDFPESSGCLQTFVSFVGEKEEQVKARSKTSHTEGSSSRTNEDLTTADLGVSLDVK